MKNPYEYVKILPNIIPDEHLNILTKHALEGKGDTSQATVGADSDKIDLEYRNTLWIPIPDDMRANLHNAIAGIYESSLINVYEQNIVNLEPVQMLYYPIGGKYDQHNDSEEFIDDKLVKTINRDVSVICYLNDDYEGGELEFIFLGLKIKPKKGTIIAFPSYFEFTHRVHPVTKGDRFSLVTWIETNDRIYEREI